jgi:hypothetical protein
VDREPAVGINDNGYALADRHSLFTAGACWHEQGAGLACPTGLTSAAFAAGRIGSNAPRRMQRDYAPAKGLSVFHARTVGGKFLDRAERLDLTF